MVRLVSIGVGSALMVLALLLAASAIALARVVMTPQQVSQLCSWALAIGLMGFMVLAVACINWSMYHPSNIQLPFVNER